MSNNKNIECVTIVDDGKFQSYMVVVVFPALIIVRFVFDAKNHIYR